MREPVPSAVISLDGFAALWGRDDGRRAALQGVSTVTVREEAWFGACGRGAG